MIFLSVSENILLLISGVGILQGILLAAVIYFHPKSERSINSFLAFYILCISIPMLLPLAQYLFPWQIYIFAAVFAVLQGPLLYLYVRSFKEVITWKKTWPHLLWFVLYIFMIGGISIFMGSKYPPEKNMPAGVLHHPLTIIPISLRYLQMMFYFFLARRELNAYQRSIRHLFSETSRINLSWVRLLVNGYVLLLFAAIALYSLVLRNTEYFGTLILINAAIVSPYIYMATYKGINQPTLWQIQPGVDKKTVEEEMQNAGRMVMKKIENEKSLLQKAKTETGKIEEMVTKIVAAMEQDKLYQEPELTLQSLADKLQLPSYQVSQAINEGMNKNFYEVINSYRVEEAKRLLLDSRNSNYTILSVGFEAGFNSKTTFNTVFKKFTGLTPTDFRLQQRDKLSGV